MNGSEENLPPNPSGLKSVNYTLFDGDPLHDLLDINSKVQIISDYLAAYTKISKRRQVGSRNASTAHERTSGVVPSHESSNEPQTSVESRLPHEEQMPERTSRDRRGTTYLTYRMEEQLIKRPAYLTRRSSKFVSPEDILSNLDLNAIADSRYPIIKNCFGDLSNVDFPYTDETNPVKMLEMIQNELNTLREEVPSTSPLTSELSNCLIHFQECSKCSKKFELYLPQILNRVQKLVRHVTLKKDKRNCVWTTDCRHHRTNFTDSSTRTRGSGLDRGREIQKSRKVEAADLTEHRPGVQIQLLVKKDQTKKKIYERAERVPETVDQNPRTVTPLYLLIKSRWRKVFRFCHPFPVPDLHWETTRTVVVPKGVASALPVTIVHGVPQNFIGFIGSPVGFKPSVASGRHGQVRRQRSRSRSPAKREKKAKGKDSEGRSLAKARVRERVAGFRLSNIYKNATELVRDLLDEAHDEDMLMETMKDIETEVTNLKEIMLEVQKNQTELSQVLLEKGVYSMAIIKMTDPSLLEEENQGVRKVAEFDVSDGNSSAEDLQNTIIRLQSKCSVKNRMILALLKCLRSEAPKEMWEDLVDCIFNDTKPIEEFDTERVNEFIRQTSTYLLKEEKASTASLPPAQIQDLSSEDCSLMSIMTFPAYTPLSMDLAIKNLENQIAVLNTENDRLWRQVNQLRAMLKERRSESHSQTRISAESSRPKEVLRSSEKTVNLVVQVEDGERRARQHGGWWKAEDRDGRDDLYPTLMWVPEDNIEEEEVVEYVTERESEDLLNFPEEVIRCVEGTSLSDFQCKSKRKDKLRAVVQAKIGERVVTFADMPVATSLLATTNDLGPSLGQGPRPCDPGQAGPSTAAQFGRRRSDPGKLHRRPSLIELAESHSPGTVAMMANDRDLETIPENEFATFQPSSSPSSRRQSSLVLQRMKTRVKISKDAIASMVARNDRMDEILNKMRAEEAEEDEDEEEDDDHVGCNPRPCGFSQEDFTEVVNRKRKALIKQTEKLTSMLDPSHASSFVQNILHEDSKTGVAVVDLFVAVKRAKDKLNFLTKINDEVLKKMNQLNKEAGTIKVDYRDFVRNINDFFDKMSGEMDGKYRFHGVSDAMKVLKMNGLQPEMVNGKTRKKKSDAEVSSTNTCDISSLYRRRTPDSNRSDSRDSLKVQQTADNCKGSRLRVLNMTPEDMVATLIVSTLQNKRARSSQDRCQVEAPKSQNEGGLKLSETNVQMICDICEILSKITPETWEMKEDGRAGSTADLSPKSSGPSSGTRAREPGMPGQKRDSGSSDDNSESGSVFEEALSEPIADAQSITCMGDLTVVNKKSVSTLTTNNGLESSWISRFTDDIKSKLKNLKNNFIKHSTQPGSSDNPMKGMGGLEFTISANTPVGVFDVTVRQYKQMRQKSGEMALDTSSSSSQHQSEKCLAPSSIEKVHFVNDPDYDWSEESFQNSDSDRMSQVGWNSGEEEMEEFLEVYVQSQATLPEGGNQPSLPLERGVMLKTKLMQDKPPIFEIEKFHPRYFIQEILPKQARIESVSSKTLTSDKLSEQDSAPANVSDDLVLYIQVDMDGKQKKEPKETPERQGKTKAISSAPKESMSCRLRRTVEKCKECIERASAMAFRPLMVDKATGSDECLAGKPERRGESTQTLTSSPREIRNLRLWATSTAVRYLQSVEKAEVCILYTQVYDVEVTELPVTVEVEELVETEIPELQTALSLIHEIENNVVGVKLSDAILILPTLESELRKHLQKKMRDMSEDEGSPHSSLQDFFSAVEFLRDKDNNNVDQDDDDEDADSTTKSDDAEERLCNLLSLLASLENAVRSNEETTPSNVEVCHYSCSRIYQLLHALTTSIKELQNRASLTDIAETLNIASLLDTAVREYDSSMRQREEDRLTLKIDATTEETSAWREASVSHQMQDIRKKVFRAVEEEAFVTEGRLERDFDRLDKLERENDESTKFVDAFIEKTSRRAWEVDAIKAELSELSQKLEKIYTELREQGKTRRIQTQARETLKPGKTFQAPLRNTVSGLLSSLKTMKMRAQEKNEICKQILESVACDISDNPAPVKHEKKVISKGSKTSLKSNFPENLLTTIRDFRKIGETSLYLSWSSPEGALAEYITGYEIVVNDSLNQRVRNPHRTQAILYSVDLSKRVDIHLFATIENGSKVLLASVTHYDE